MNLKKTLVYGIAIWAAVYLVACIFVAYKAQNTTLAKVVMTVVLIIAAYIAGRKINLSASSILKYSIGWAIIAFVLDIILTAPFIGGVNALFSTQMLLNYALIIVVPVLSAKRI